MALKIENIGGEEQSRIIHMAACRIEDWWIYSSRAIHEAYLIPDTPECNTAREKSGLQPLSRKELCNLPKPEETFYGVCKECPVLVQAVRAVFGL